MTPPAIFLMGPTASGKTDAAVALRERLRPLAELELVSVDSALVYRGMDIGAAKPDAATRARAPHRLIDLIEPTEAYSAGRFKTDALRAMAEISAQGGVPLLVGGTMLYFRALLGGLDDLPPADPGVRAELEARAARHGWPALHAELRALDPETAARLHVNDAQRIQRALELCLTTGGPMSALLRARAPQGATPPQERPAPPAGRLGGCEPGAVNYRVLQLALFPGERAWLHERINQRFSAMLEAGLVDELRALRARHALNAGLPSMRCVGYRQAWAFLEGEIDAQTLAQQGAAATRQLAKRQLTWLRGWQGAEVFDCQRTDLVDALEARVRAFLQAADRPPATTPR